MVMTYLHYMHTTLLLSGAVWADLCGRMGQRKRGEDEMRAERGFFISQAVGVFGRSAVESFWMVFWILEDLLVGLPWLCVNGLVVPEDVGVCRWDCGRLVWTETVPMSYVRVPRVPPFLQCCHGNCSGSLLLEVLCEEEEPTWQRSQDTADTREGCNKRPSVSYRCMCFVFGRFIEPGRRIILNIVK